MSAYIDDTIQVGDFFAVTYVDSPTKTYNISPDRIVGYYPFNISEQITILYDDLRKEWIPFARSQRISNV